jgi:hypothetical protein
VLGDDELGACVALSVCQCHLPPGGTPMLIDVGQATGGGLLKTVVSHPEAQGVPVEGSRLLEIAHAESHLGHPQRRHHLSSFVPGVYS